MRWEATDHLQELLCGKYWKDLTKTSGLNSCLQRRYGWIAWRHRCHVRHNGKSEHYEVFTKIQYYLKCNYSGINSVKLFTRNQYQLWNPIQVSIDIVEIWYRTGTRLIHGTCETCICYCPIEKFIKLFWDKKNQIQPLHKWFRMVDLCDV